MNLPLVTLALAALLVGAASFSVPSKHVFLQQRNNKVSAAPVRIAPGQSTLKSASDDDVSFVIQSMLKNSQFVYNFAALRNIVNEHDTIIREGVPAKKKTALFFKKDKPLVDFYRPNLIVTQRGAQEDNLQRYLQYPITAAAILEFIQNNRHLLDDSEGDIAFLQKNDDTPLKMEKNMERQAKFDGEILDYDDQFTTNAGLVYGLTINRSKKRITVTFRGTVGGGDIVTDANFFKSTPDVFKDCDFKTHSGFSSYLFKEIPGEGRSKFDRIVAAIKEVYDELPGSDAEKDKYELIVSGHSLGGGLANLFAFAVAKTQSHYKFFDRVTAVTFAAPVVGDKAYNEAFQALEKEDILRVIRVSNEGDVVPTQPVPGYTQNGVNLHLYPDKELVLGYRNSKVLPPQWLLNVFGEPSVLGAHLFPEYEKRLKLPKNAKILEKSMKELYEATAVTKDFSG